MSHPFDDLGAYLLGMAGDMGKMRKQAVKLTAEQARDRMMMAARKLAGPDLMFSNLGKAKAILGVRVEFTEEGETTVCTLEATGPWAIGEYPIPAHVISPKMGAVSRKGRKKVDYERARRQRDLDIAFGARGTFSGLRPLGNNSTGFGPLYKVTHPGTKGKGAWADAKGEAEALAIEELGEQMVNQVAVRFAG